MPYGKYRGRKMSEIPDGYLLWMFDNDKLSNDLKENVQERIGLLRFLRDRQEKEDRKHKLGEMENQLLQYIYEHIGGSENISSIEENCGSIWIETESGTYYIQVENCSEDHMK